MFKLASFVFAVLLPSAILSELCTGGIPDSERKDILDAHNKLRSEIALGTYTAKGKTVGPAANMAELTWNCDLETSSQEWANNCKFKHSHGPYGENLYMALSSEKMKITGQGAKASNSWENEFQKYGFPGAYMKTFDSRVGHATQMAWANSTTVGCGMALCKDETAVLVVCRYLAQGNILKNYIFEEGKPCTDCPTGSKCDKNLGLCEIKDPK